MGPEEFDPPLDKGIVTAVRALRAAGVETYESCDGSDGHAFLEPTVRFHGNQSEGYRAFSIALNNDLRVSELRRVWQSLGGELVGPYWEMTFFRDSD